MQSIRAYIDKEFFVIQSYVNSHTVQHAWQNNIVQFIYTLNMHSVVNLYIRAVYAPSYHTNLM